MSCSCCRNAMRELREETAWRSLVMYSCRVPVVFGCNEKALAAACRQELQDSLTHAVIPELRRFDIQRYTCKYIRMMQTL